MKIFDKIKDALLYTWQLPQNLLGLFIYSTNYTDKELQFDDIKVKVSRTMNGGISLGKYVTIANQRMVPHELGHTIQSNQYYI